MSITIHRIQTEDMLRQAFTVRHKVFVDEQKVPQDLELDEYDNDDKTIHILAQNERNQPVGTARFRPHSPGSVCKVERVAVLSTERGTGLGKQIMQFLEQEAAAQGYQEAYLNAQTQAIEFYRRLGYKPEGVLFYEAGIEHIAMRKPLNRDFSDNQRPRVGSPGRR